MDIKLDSDVCDLQKNYDIKKKGIKHDWKHKGFIT